MADAAVADKAQLENSERLRYSVSTVRQGKHVFYTLTMPSEVPDHAERSAEPDMYGIKREKKTRNSGFSESLTRSGLLR